HPRPYDMAQRGADALQRALEVGEHLTRLCRRIAFADDPPVRVGGRGAGDEHLPADAHRTAVADLGFPGRPRRERSPRHAGSPFMEVRATIFEPARACAPQISLGRRLSRPSRPTHASFVVPVAVTSAPVARRTSYSSVTAALPRSATRTRI